MRFRISNSFAHDLYSNFGVDSKINSARIERERCRITFFIWPAERIAHLAENGITPEEFEEVVCNPSHIDVSRTTGRQIAFGLTAEGRELICVYEFLDRETIYPFTAFEKRDD